MALSHLEFNAIPLLQQCLTHNFLAICQPTEVYTVNLSNISQLRLALHVPEEM